MNGVGGGLCFSARPRDERKQGCLVQTLPLAQLSLTGSDRCNAGRVARKKKGSFEAGPFIQSRPLGF